MKRWIALALPVVVSAVLVAQELSGAPDVRGPVASPFNVTDPSGPPVILNAPYSAEVISTFDKVLASGKRVHRETHGKVYRDSQGRTRTEAAPPAAPKPLPIRISDPVERCTILLDSSAMTAKVNPWHVATSRPTGTFTPRPAASAEPPDAPVPSAGLPTPSDAVPGNGPIGGAVPKKSAASEELGTREMEGLTVSGIKSILTANRPAEGDGQSNTVITTTIVQWEARDMGIVVVNDKDDAQLGHFTTKLMNIVRTEPDPALFQIPSGYTVTDRRPQTKGQD